MIANTSFALHKYNYSEDLAKGNPDSGIQSNREFQFGALKQEIEEAAVSGLEDIVTKWGQKLLHKADGKPRAAEKIAQILSYFHGLAGDNSKVSVVLNLIAARINPSLFTMVEVNEESQAVDTLIREPLVAQAPERTSEEMPKFTVPLHDPQILATRDEKNSVGLFALHIYGAGLKKLDLLRVKIIGLEDSTHVKLEYYIGEPGQKLQATRLIASEVVERGKVMDYPILSPKDWSSFDNYDLEIYLSSKIATFMAITRLNGDRYEFIPFGRQFDFVGEPLAANASLFEGHNDLCRVHTFLVRDKEKEGAVFAFIVGGVGYIELTLQDKFRSESVSQKAAQEFNSAAWFEKDAKYYRAQVKKILKSETVGLYELNYRLTKQKYSKDYRLKIKNLDDRLLLIPLDKEQVKSIQFSFENNVNHNAKQEAKAYADFMLQKSWSMLQARAAAPATPANKQTAKASFNDLKSQS